MTESSTGEVPSEHEQARAEFERRLVALDGTHELDRAVIASLAPDLAGCHSDIVQISAALVAARRIGAALGILMAGSKIGEGDAFAMLARMSQRQNRSLRDVAEDILFTGDLWSSW